MLDLKHLGVEKVIVWVGVNGRMRKSRVEEHYVRTRPFTINLIEFILFYFTLVETVDWSKFDFLHW